MVKYLDDVGQGHGLMTRSRPEHARFGIGDVPLAADALDHWFKRAFLEALIRDGFADVSLVMVRFAEHLPCEGAELATLVAISASSKQAVGQTVEQLRKRAYVSVEPLPGDGRRRLVRPTDRGRSLAENARNTRDAILARLSDAMDLDRVHDLVRDLVRMTDLLQGLNGLG